MVKKKNQQTKNAVSVALIQKGRKPTWSSKGSTFSFCLLSYKDIIKSVFVHLRQSSFPARPVLLNLHKLQECVVYLTMMMKASKAKASAEKPLGAWGFLSPSQSWHEITISLCSDSQTNGPEVHSPLHSHRSGQQQTNKHNKNLRALCVRVPLLQPSFSWGFSLRTVAQQLLV